jgi:3-polyprenyl-4-hydroxybenzoate decarboxylase
MKKSIIVNQIVNRVLDLVDIELLTALFQRWQGGQVVGEP